MLRPVRMVMLDCIVPSSYKTGLVEALHKEGIAQVEFFGDEHLAENGLERDIALERVNDVSMLLIRTRKIIDILKVFDKTETNLIEDFLDVDKSPTVSVSDLEYDEVMERSHDLLEKVEDNVQSLEESRASLDECIARLDDDIRRYKKLSSLTVDLGALRDSEYLSISFGTAPLKSLDSIRAVEKEFDKSVALVASGEDSISFAVVSLNEQLTDVQQYLREQDSELVDVSAEGVPGQIVERLERERKAALADSEGNVKKLNALFDKHYANLLAAEELLLIEKERCEVFYSCGKTQSTILMRLWVPKTQVGAVEDIIGNRTKGTAFIKKDPEPENAPVLLDNPRVIKSFESLVRLFGLPKYNELDPTVFLFIPFALFFGAMLTDAVYGVMLILFSIFIYKKYGEVSSKAKDAAVIFSMCGLFAILFGVLTGSYLGDFLGTYILGAPNGPQSIALWIDPLFEANAIVFLIAMCLIGFIHLFSGFFLGAYDSLRRGEVKIALTHYISWFILLAGGLLLAGSMYPDGAPFLPEAFTYVGGAVLAVGAGLQFIGKKAMFLMDLIGLLGNTLSYARLLAMGLTTAGIALSFNILASLAMNIPYVGVFIAIFVFLIGHIINILLNSLGAFIHSMRLQYVEWFGTFYGGGGIMFQPFKEKRRYTVRVK